MRSATASASFLVLGGVLGALFVAVAAHAAGPAGDWEREGMVAGRWIDADQRLAGESDCLLHQISELRGALEERSTARIVASLLDPYPGHPDSWEFGHIHLRQAHEGAEGPQVSYDRDGSVLTVELGPSQGAEHCGIVGAQLLEEELRRVWQANVHPRSNSGG